MNYVVARVNAKRKDYPDMSPETGDPQEIAAVNARMLTIDKYHELARRIIGKWAPPHARVSMLESEDAVDYVAHKIMMGDWGYNESKSEIETCRGYCGQRAIQDYLGDMKKQCKFVTNYFDSGTHHDGEKAPNVIPDTKSPSPKDQFMAEEQRKEDRQEIKRIMEDLNDTQRACVTMFYMDDMNMTQIARELDMSREGVRKSINEALKQMRTTSNVR